MPQRLRGQKWVRAKFLGGEMNYTRILDGERSKRT